MPVWRRLLDAIERRGAAVMVTVVAAKGSTPREAGARMIVHPDGKFTGTIGGGTLEWKALALAQAAFGNAAGPKASIRSFALGPELGQCCGGRVELLIERFDSEDQAAVAAFAGKEEAGGFATTGRITDAGVLRTVADDATTAGAASFEHGTLREGFGESRREILLFGSGHVGKALVLALAPLPFRVTWVDPRADAFPAYVPGNVSAVQLSDPTAAIATAAPGAFVLVMSHSHQLDLALVSAALADGRFPYVGLIGSDTKRARFEKRMAEAGIPRERIAELVCPIGIDGIESKQPAVIAAATVAELIIRDEALKTAANTEKSLYPAYIGRIS